MVIKAKYERAVTDQNGDLEITFKVHNYPDKQAVSELEQVDYRLTCSPLKSRRSYQQNALMWELIHDIGKARGTDRANDDEDIYLEALVRAGAKYEYIACLPEAEDLLMNQFRAVKYINSFDHHGRKMNQYKVFYGSSKMTTEEMSNLLETVMDMAAEEGINV